MAEQMRPMPDVPERCPQCHSPVVERFPIAVMYDCGFWFFNDEQPVTDDYPAECQRRRIKRLEKQLAAARAEAERWKQQYEFLRSEMERLVQELRQRAYLFAKDWLETDDDYYEGASDAYYSAEKMVRRLLSEAGGVSQ